MVTGGSKGGVTFGEDLDDHMIDEGGKEREGRGEITISEDISQQDRFLEEMNHTSGWKARVFRKSRPTEIKKITHSGLISP